MARAVFCYIPDSFHDVIHDKHIHLERKIFPPLILFLQRNAINVLPAFIIDMEDNTLRICPLLERREEFRCNIPANEKAFCGIAGSRIVNLGIDRNLKSLVQICIFIDIHCTDTVSMSEDRKKVKVSNVLQSMILTDTKGTGHMVLTPTYHVFEMYKGFMGATFLPMEIKCDSMDVRGDSHAKGGRRIPILSASAAKQKDGSIIISLANVSLDEAQEVEIALGNIKAEDVNGSILSCKSVTDYNDFEHPENVCPREFKSAKLSKGTLKTSIPAKSIVVLNLK